MRRARAGGAVPEAGLRARAGRVAPPERLDLRQMTAGQVRAAAAGARAAAAV